MAIDEAKRGAVCSSAGKAPRRCAGSRALSRGPTLSIHVLVRRRQPSKKKTNSTVTTKLAPIKMYSSQGSSQHGGVLKTLRSAPIRLGLFSRQRNGEDAGDAEDACVASSSDADGSGGISGRGFSQEGWPLLHGLHPCLALAPQRRETRSTRKTRYSTVAPR